MSVFQRRLLGVSDASGAGPQAAAGRRPGPQHRRHGGLLPHPSGTHCLHLSSSFLWVVVSLLLVVTLLPVQVSQELLQDIRETVLQKTVDGMKEEGTPYVGRCSVCISLCVQHSFLASDYYKLVLLPCRRAVRWTDVDQTGAEGPRVQLSVWRP